MKDPSREPFNFGRDVFDRWARVAPARPALYLIRDAAHADIVGYGELARASDGLAARLAAAGITPGTRVLVVLGKAPEFWVTLLALNKLGAVPMPGTTQLRPADIRYRLEAAACRAAIVLPGIARTLTDPFFDQQLTFRFVTGGDEPAPAGWTPLDAWAPASGPPDGPVTSAGDPALIYFTSGTTGHPKMVVHTQAYTRAHRLTASYWLGLQEGMLHWNFSDTGWAKAAWSSVFAPWNVGATVVVDPLTGKFQPRAFLELLAGHPVESLCAAPTVYRFLVQEDLGRYRFPALRSAVSAGEPLNPEVIETFRRHTGLTVRDGYGQTETVVLVANPPGAPVKPGSMGKPAPGWTVAVIDEDGRELPPGEEGEVAVRVDHGRPEGLFAEYAADPEGTRRRFRGPWYLTGDRAQVDEDGYFWFVGRADDVIISAGYRIGPFEVESALLEHPAVAESAVVAHPDPLRGSVVKAFVVLAPGWRPGAELAAELQTHVRAITAPYKYPRLIEFVEELPKTISGKIRRVELRERGPQG
ncbi:Acetyl-CoA synthetase [Candidatus Hydrogenisulfobacillus filiaventi]|uniref:Acetyl-CoA synthetase n=1 Tax=Candidatus Hydrogenisulfobacillus filiaventi TaxID=2707344 RepID=A0A6F8ZK54_9FIRM|nr:Acetyl-CoA synthetase [Candidatus Hydrogenisulfobacillus filiaventi]